MRTRRRASSLFIVAILTNAILAACSTPDSAGSVSVLGSWTDGEQQSFEKVLKQFTLDTGVQVKYQGTRAVDEELASEMQNGTPPDIAILSNPGGLRQYLNSNKLHSLDDVTEKPERDAYIKQWPEVQRLGTGSPYGVVVKVSLKSLIWYNPRQRPAPEVRTWDQLVTLGETIARTGGRPWCMGMGSTPISGWPGTDWIEDILLHQFGTGIYQQWASGKLSWTSEQVKKAWREWGTITASAGSRSALLTDWTDAGRPMFTNPPGCYLDHQASFIMASYQNGRKDKLKPGADFDFFPFPADAAAGAFKVSGDMATMFNDTPQARQLIKYLATAEAQAIWPHSGGGGLSVNKKVNHDVYPDSVSKKIADTLTNATTLCYDAADLMPTTMRDAFRHAVLEYLSDPNQLDQLLDELDKVRLGIAPAEWLTMRCGH
ncbi:MAG: carbohydrate ABC transporter substrate-binding protein [Pseudonocardiales bacterium]|nr:carbohydrate ABC transporter substrate-binding protein [Pseudonocardiales bacterium]MBV9031474.1 carbohydrate ABC transporter substrate-binding protein [Pseudonocardiales bacterium]